MELSDAAGDDSMGNWQGWIFNEEQTATQRQQGGQRASIFSADSHRRLIHQSPAELSFHLTLQGLQRSPVSCHFVPPAYTSTPFHPHTPVLPQPSLSCIFDKDKNKPGVSPEIFSSTIKNYNKKKKFGTPTWGGWFLWIHLHSIASFCDLYL